MAGTSLWSPSLVAAVPPAPPCPCPFVQPMPGTWPVGAVPFLGSKRKDQPFREGLTLPTPCPLPLSPGQARPGPLSAPEPPLLTREVSDPCRTHHFLWWREGGAYSSGPCALRQPTPLRA